MVRLLGCFVLCGALGAFAAPNPKLDEAKQLIEDLELEAALKRLDAAEATPGNSRQTLVEIASLRGATLATLGRTRPAEEAFRLVLFLEPGFKLGADHAPRVRTPFYAARDWAAKNGTLVASAEVQQAKLVERIGVEVKSDALKLAARVRFHVRVDGAWKVEEVAVVSGRATRAVGQPGVQWWAEVLSPLAAVLLTFGSEETPRVDEVPVTEQPGRITQPASVVMEPAPPTVEARPPSAPSVVRVLSFSLVGAAALAAGIGVALGVSSNAARAQFLTAARDPNGLVTGLSRRDALALETRSRSEATMANVLFIAAAALAASGVALFVVDSQNAKLVMVPTPGGVAVAGHF